MSEVYARIYGCKTAAQLVNLANSMHDPRLVGSGTDDPNGVLVYKLWDDGEITFEKGAAAYGKRNVFTKMLPINPSPFRRGCFAGKFRSVSGNIISYVICSETDAINLRTRAVEIAVDENLENG